MPRQSKQLININLQHCIEMTKRKSTLFYSMLIIFLLLFSVAISQTIAQESGAKSTTDLSNNQSPQKDEDLSAVNWDDAEEDTAETKDDTGNDDLSNASWEDEDSSEADTEESGGLQSYNKDEIQKLESKERLIHITGFMLFFGYIMGGILTAFITRNRKIAVIYPPELLILLHTVWPLELLMLPLLGKPVR